MKSDNTSAAAKAEILIYLYEEALLFKQKR